MTLSIAAIPNLKPANPTQSRQDAKLLTFSRKSDRKTDWRKGKAKFSKKSLRLYVMALRFLTFCLRLNFRFGIAVSIASKKRTFPYWFIIFLNLSCLVDLCVIPRFTNVELDMWLKFGVPYKAKFIALVNQINACQEIGMDSQLGIMV